MTAGPTTNIPLQGRALTLARLLWAAAFAVALIVFVFGIPLRYTQLGSDIIGAGLEQYGFSGGVYAGYRLTLEVLYVLIFWFLGLLIFWRRPEDRLAIFVSVFLITFGLTGIPGYSILDAYEAYRPAVLLPLSRVVDFVGWPCLYTFFYLFPTGCFVPRWTRFMTVFMILAAIPWNLFPDSPLAPPNWPLTIFIPFVVLAWLTMGFA